MNNKLIIVNPSDRDWTKHRYILVFGTYGQVKHLVWANHLQGALDESIDWLAEHAPGILADNQVKEEYDRLIAEGASEEDAWEGATIDTTCGGNYSNYLLSWEWSVLAEDPTREQILRIQGRI
jgi:hypothetical protein